tara:strand:+ start:1747 stop:2061 length:315 start_codon:yes stop_codon:yes gene_type:complete
MFRGQGLAKPTVKSLVGTLAVIILAMLGSRASPVLGYVFAVSALIMIIVVMLTDSIWPTQSRKENSLVFALFWGLMIGVIAPHLVSTVSEGGVSAIYELLTSEP